MTAATNCGRTRRGAPPGPAWSGARDRAERLAAPDIQGHPWCVGPCRLSRLNPCHGDVERRPAVGSAGRRARGRWQAVWRLKRRLRRLEGELAEAKADQAELRRRLELFEMIAA